MLNLFESVSYKRRNASMDLFFYSVEKIIERISCSSFFDHEAFFDRTERAKTLFTLIKRS